MSDTAAGSRSSLSDVARPFLRLGSIGFGGPASHIAMMEDEVVRRRHWLSPDEFLDLVGASSLIPGPNSTELAIHIGLRRAGWPGLLVAGASFIVPAVAIVGVLAWAYVRYRRLPEVGGLLYGIKPVIIAIVVQALWSLGRAACKTRLLAALAGAALVARVLGADEIALLVAVGLAAGAGGVVERWRQGKLVGAAAPLVLAAAPAQVAFGLWPLFLVFVKIGSVLFGSGYVLLAFLRADLVERHGWLTEAELLDAVAVGQMTPGPVFTTATFIGYMLAGAGGAAAATLGIFLPAFVFVAASGPLLPLLRTKAGPFLDGVNAASLALMALVTWQLGRAALVDVPTIALAAASAAALVFFRVNSAWLVLIGGVVGLLSHSGSI